MLTSFARLVSGSPFDISLFPLRKPDPILPQAGTIHQQYTGFIPKTSSDARKEGSVSNESLRLIIFTYFTTAALLVWSVSGIKVIDKAPASFSAGTRLVGSADPLSALIQVISPRKRKDAKSAIRHLLISQPFFQSTAILDMDESLIVFHMSWWRDREFHWR